MQILKALRRLCMASFHGELSWLAFMALIDERKAIDDAPDMSEQLRMSKPRCNGIFMNREINCKTGETTIVATEIGGRQLNEKRR